MKIVVFALVLATLSLFLSAVFTAITVIDCSGPDEFLVWGNTYKFGFTTYELQCYRGRFE